MSTFSNFEAKEGTVTAEETLVFTKKMRQFLLINDSATIDLLFKFNASETFGTLQPDEQVSLDIIHNNVIIKSEDGVTTATYRIWGIG